ncbi:MAG: hypothetical protein IJH47_03505 [Oscillospiraceae bacterium]|nr:hypothetical protein [Oscillospiraceae bacterium]
MSDEKTFDKLPDETLENVSGGMSANLEAAYAVNKGQYGGADVCAANLRRAGLNPDAVLGLADALNKYEDVAFAVIRGEYGRGQARTDALTAAGYPADTIQLLVNNMLWDPKTETFGVRK